MEKCNFSGNSGLETNKEIVVYAQPEWSIIPNVILEKTFSYLPIREKYYCSLACKSWYDAFKLPEVWTTFTFDDSTLTRAQLDHNLRLQYALDYYQFKKCITSVGDRIRQLIMSPTANHLHILNDRIKMFVWTIDENKVTGNNIKYLKFTFPYDRIHEPTEDLGISNELLRTFTEFLKNLKKLEKLELIDLHLKMYQFHNLMEELLEVCQLTLTTLIVVNPTIRQSPMSQAGKFPNLYQLIISPQNLNDNVVMLIGNTNLRHLHIFQNRNTPDRPEITPVSANAWELCKKNNPHLWVHLELDSLTQKLMVWQESAPVRTVFFNTPSSEINNNEMKNMINLYSKYLKTYGHLSRVEVYRSEEFCGEIENNLILLVRECPLLSTLVVTGMISTATVLMLARTGRNLKRLYIKRNNVIVNYDRTQSWSWSSEFSDWLKMSSRTYDLVELEVTKIFGYKWKFMSDKDFRHLNIDFHNP